MILGPIPEETSQIQRQAQCTSWTKHDLRFSKVYVPVDINAQSYCQLEGLIRVLSILQSLFQRIRGLEFKCASMVACSSPLGLFLSCMRVESRRTASWNGKAGPNQTGRHLFWTVCVQDGRKKIGEGGTLHPALRCRAMVVPMFGLRKVVDL